MRLLGVNVDLREISCVETMLSDCRRVCCLDYVHQCWREVWENLQSILQRQEQDLAGQKEAYGYPGVYYSSLAGEKLVQKLTHEPRA